MPKIWITQAENGLFQTSLQPVDEGIEVEIKASKYRQIVAAHKRFWSLQVTLDRWYHQAKNKGIKRFL